MSNWIKPFQGRNSSGAYDQNFLWNKDNIYVMDNHKAALWCWLQHPITPKLGLIHIDAHYDTLDSRLDEWLCVAPNVAKICFDEFDIASYRCPDCGSDPVPIFRYDNYIPIFISRYAPQGIYSAFFTQHEGTMGDGITPDHQEAYVLPGFLEYSLSPNIDSWIVNVDFDFFYYNINSQYNLLYSENYIHHVFSNIKKLVDSGKVSCCTMALSPECCGGWGNSEYILSIASNELGIDLALA